MLRITKLTDYAIVILSDLAASYPKRQSAKALAQRTGIHLPTVSKVLKTLLRRELVVSHLGMEGGYQLALPADKVSLAQIIQALEGPIALTQCNLKNGMCEQEHNCHIRPHWQRINQVVLKTLQNVHLAEIA